MASTPEQGERQDRSEPQDGSGPARYDTIVIGAGQAGPGVAAKLAADGDRVALIEGERFGGTCLNTGCRPTKAMRASARAAHVARSSEALGVRSGDVTVDFPVVMSRIRGLLDGWRSGALTSYEGIDGLTYVHGRARLDGGDHEHGYRVVVQGEHGSQVLVAPRVVLNTGARSVPPRLEGLDGVPWLDHRSVLELETLPASMVVLGGSYIGLEFAQIFSRLGSTVTVVEPSDRIIGREDAEVSDAVRAMLVDEGIDVRVCAAPQRVDTTDGGVVVTLAGGDVVRGAALLVAAGRRPNTDGLGLETVGAEVDDHGYVVIDDVFASTAAGVYAVGDVNGHGAFTHTSYQDHEILMDHLRGGPRSLAGRRTTYALFTEPPLGRVGMSEREAEAAGHRVRTHTAPAAGIALAALEGETTGLVKLVVDDDTDALLGVAAFCLHGDELASTFSAFLHTGATLQQMLEWLPIHPTVSEYVPTFVGGVVPSTDAGAGEGA